MPRPYSLSKVATVTDIMDQGRFLLLLGSVPGGGDTDSLSVRCFNTVIPGTSSEVMEVPMHGHTLRYRGRKIHASPMTVAFWEDSNMEAYDILWEWSEAVTDTETGDSIGYLNEYSVTAQVSKFDTKGEEAARFRIYNVFPQDLTDLNLSDEGSAPLQVQCMFAFRNKTKEI